MKIDYDVGDVVVCLIDDPTMRERGMKKGAMHRVQALFHHHSGELGVRFYTVGSGRYPGYRARMFRKLPKADAGFTSLIKRKAAPKRVPENA